MNWSCALPVFLLMLSAAILGFLLSWAMRRKRIADLKTQVRKMEEQSKVYKRITEDMNVMVTALLKEKENLLTDKESHLEAIQELEIKIQQYEENKDYLYSEFSGHYTNSKMTEKKIASLKVEMSKLKERLKETETEKDILESKYQTLVSRYNLEDEGTTIHRAVDIQPGASGNHNFTIDDKYKNEIRELEEKLKKKKAANKKLKALLQEAQSRYEQDINTFINSNESLKHRLKNYEGNGESAVDEKTHEEILLKISQQKGLLDFNRIGISNESQKDNLKKLRGLGSFTEAKFNAIGIYNFGQIANLNSEDEELLNNLLELPANKIQKEGWVAESKKIAGIIESPEIILNRIRSKAQQLGISQSGPSHPTSKSKLQSINGIGPFIEQKLNAIGIYHFNQIADLKEDQIHLINDLIELAPGHIINDDWVTQAKKLK